MVPIAVSKGFLGSITGLDKPTCLPRSYKKGGHDFLDAVIDLASHADVVRGFVARFKNICVGGYHRSTQWLCRFSGSFNPYLCKGTVYLSKVPYRYFRGPLVLELSTYIIGLHEAYDFHHTLFCHPTLFMLFSFLPFPRRFLAA